MSTDTTQQAAIRELVDNIIHIGYVNGYNQLAQAAMLAPYNYIEPMSVEEASQAVAALIEAAATQRAIEAVEMLLIGSLDYDDFVKRATAKLSELQSKLTQTPEGGKK